LKYQIVFGALFIMSNHNIILPEALKPGDLIGIVSPASRVSPEVVVPARMLLEKMGYRVLMGQYVFETHHQFAGTDLQRSHDLQNMLDHPKVKAIICARGGYGSLRTLQNINWDRFLARPKWLVGFSDVTVLHAALNRFRVASVHGVMPRYFLENDQASFSFETLLKSLSGETLSYSFESSSFNRKGTATGELTGGNLSILYSLRGTPYDLDTEGKILFIEDLSEYLYHLDRMLMNLKTGGKLSKLKGLIVGAFTEMKDHETAFGKTVEEIVLDVVSDYDYPVAFHFPAGHQPENLAMRLGCTAQLVVDEQRVQFKQ
jgi:muramoyltetrapeptide carboxypeptidase